MIHIWRAPQKWQPWYARAACSCVCVCGHSGISSARWLASQRKSKKWWLLALLPDTFRLETGLFTFVATVSAGFVPFNVFFNWGKCHLFKCVGWSYGRIHITFLLLGCVIMMMVVIDTVIIRRIQKLVIALHELIRLITPIIFAVYYKATAERSRKGEATCDLDWRLPLSIVFSRIHPQKKRVSMPKSRLKRSKNAPIKLFNHFPFNFQDIQETVHPFAANMRSNQSCSKGGCETNDCVFFLLFLRWTDMVATCCKIIVQELL